MTRRCVICQCELPEPPSPTGNPRVTCSQLCADARRRENRRASYHRQCRERRREYQLAYRARKRGGRPAAARGPKPGSRPVPVERDEAMLAQREARQLLAPLDALARARPCGERLRRFFR